MNKLVPHNPKLIFELRHRLHRHAELSNQEHETIAICKEFLRGHTGLLIEEHDGWFCAWYRAANPRAKIAFRTDMDAVAIEETWNLPYASKNSGVSHRCGHDGHMAALCWLAMLLSEHGSQNDVCLVFQPAEETGDGALKCADVIKNAGIREIYAFHNLPGFPKGEIVVREGTFACASHGITLKFFGRQSHSAYPENGENPAYAIARLVSALEQIGRLDYGGFVRSTVVHISVGQAAFGISPGYGELRVTLRAEREEDLILLTRRVLDEANALCRSYGMRLETEFCEAFPATVNDAAAVKKVRENALARGLPISELTEPMRWSEDFGHFLKRMPGAIFGIGAGRPYAALHTVEYDFPDDILSVAASMLFSLSQK